MPVSHAWLTPLGSAAAASCSKAVLCDPRRSEPGTSSTSGIGDLPDQQQIDVPLAAPAARVAPAGQLHLPREAEVAAVEARLELQSRDLAVAARPRRRIAPAGADRARDAPDRELA